MSVERNLGLLILLLSIISVMSQSNVFNKTTSVKPSRSISPLLQDPTVTVSSVQPLRTPSVSLSSVFTTQELQTSISNAETPSPSPSLSSTNTFLSRSSMNSSSIMPTKSIETSGVLLKTVQSSTALTSPSTVGLSLSSVKSISEMTVWLVQSKSYSSSSSIVSTTSTKYSLKLTVSDFIQETNTPTVTTTVSNCVDLSLLVVQILFLFCLIDCCTEWHTIHWSRTWLCCSNCCCGHHISCTLLLLQIKKVRIQHRKY